MNDSNPKHLAKRICKRLEKNIALALTVRPMGPAGWSTLQGYRTALNLCAAACAEYGLSDEEIHVAVQASIDGFKEVRRAGSN